MELKEALRKRKGVFLLASCRLWYSGRAESFLDLGERIILVKPDGNVIIHQKSGSQPVNWMSSGFVRLEERVLPTLIVENKGECLKVELETIQHCHIFDMSDDVRLVTAGSEKDMAIMIYNNPSLIGVGFKPLSMEEHTKYGFIDVFGHDENNNLVVVECKRYSAGLSAVQQLRRYVEKMKKVKGVVNVRGFIAAPKITTNALQMLTDWGYEFKSVDPPKFFEDIKKRQTRLSQFK